MKTRMLSLAFVAVLPACGSYLGDWGYPSNGSGYGSGWKPVEIAPDVTVLALDLASEEESRSLDQLADEIAGAAPEILALTGARADPVGDMTVLADLLRTRGLAYGVAGEAVGPAGGVAALLVREAALPVTDVLRGAGWIAADLATSRGALRVIVGDLRARDDAIAAEAVERMLQDACGTGDPIALVVALDDGGGTAAAALAASGFVPSGDGSEEAPRLLLR